MKAKYVLRAAGQALLHGIRTLPFEVAGFFVVPFLYRYRQVPLSVMKTEHPRLLPWVNPEDWTDGWRGHPDYYETIPKDLWADFPGRWGFYKYHALRNRAHGLRNYEWHNLPMSLPIEYQTPDLVSVYQDWYIWKYRKPQAGDRWWHVTRMRKKYFGVRYIRYFKFRGTLYYYQCKFGWRIGPYDVAGPVKNSFRWLHGTTPTFQPAQFGRAGRDYD